MKIIIMETMMDKSQEDLEEGFIRLHQGYGGQVHLR